MASITAKDVELRFSEEQRHIFAYVEAVTKKMARIDDVSVRQLGTSLKLSHLPACFQRPRNRLGESFSQDEINQLIASIDGIEVPLESALSALAAGPDSVCPKWKSQVLKAHQPLFVELIEFFCRQLRRSLSDDARNELINRAFEEFRDPADGYDAVLKSDPQLHRDLVVLSLRVAEWQIVADQISGLISIKDKFAAMRLAARMQIPEAEINILRQGFILLMTAFDAAVFDLTRVALRADFFNLVAKIGHKDKVALSKLSDYESFDQFRDSIIEDQLKRMYVKDLLAVLKSGDNDFVELTELILRRNVHIHNRGVVDERYLDRNVEGKPQHNLHALKLGQIAVIDRPYFDRANILCDSCVRSLSQWASNPA